MTLFLFSFCIISLLVVAMSIGTLAGRGPIKGSCGGMSALGMDTECDICGGDPAKCEESQSENSTDEIMAYNAMKKRS